MKYLPENNCRISVLITICNQPMKLQFFALITWNVCVTIDPFVQCEHHPYTCLTYIKARFFQVSKIVSQGRTVVKWPLHKSLKRMRSSPSHKYPFSSLNLVFILHQAVSKTVKVHYVSQNWAEVAVFMRNIDTLRCILEIRLQIPFIRHHKYKWLCRNLTMGFCG